MEILIISMYNRKPRTRLSALSITILKSGKLVPEQNLPQESSSEILPQWGSYTNFAVSNASRILLNPNCVKPLYTFPGDRYRRAIKIGAQSLSHSPIHKYIYYSQRNTTPDIEKESEKLTRTASPYFPIPL